jgi:hypothetical protein
MRHHRVPKSNKHKKRKEGGCEGSDDERRPTVEAPLKVGKKKRKEPTVEELREQKMPRKMVEMFSAAKGGESKTRKKKKKTKIESNLLSVTLTADQGDEKGMTRGLKELPDKLVQGLYETEDQFLHRLDRLKNRALNEAKIETKYDLDSCPQIISTSDGKSVKQKGAEDEEEVNKRRVKRKEREQKMREKKRMKNREAVDEKDPFSHLKDDVKFGEVCMAPPSLSHQLKQKMGAQKKEGRTKKGIKPREEKVRKHIVRKVLTCNKNDCKSNVMIPLFLMGIHFMLRSSSQMI